MTFYYLNDKNEPQGPFTEKEMRVLLEKGVITPDTKAARAGAAEWQPLSQIAELTPPTEGATDAPSADTVPAAGGTPPPLPETYLGNCPHCEQPLHGTAVPAVCPHCQQDIHPQDDSLWTQFVYCFTHPFTLRGRATRTEYWGYYLFSSIIGIGLNFALNIAGLFGNGVLSTTAIDDADDIDITSSDWVLLTLYLLAWLIFAVPQCSVSIRRLHDRGISAAFFLLYGLLLIPLLLCFVPLAGSFSEHVGAFIVGSLLLGFLIFMVLGIIFFVYMVLPGTPGPNKYGPNLRVPRA